MVKNILKVAAFLCLITAELHGVDALPTVEIDGVNIVDVSNWEVTKDLGDKIPTLERVNAELLEMDRKHPDLRIAERTGANRGKDSLYGRILRNKQYIYAINKALRILPKGGDALNLTTGVMADFMDFISKDELMGDGVLTADNIVGKREKLAILTIGNCRDKFLDFKRSREKEKVGNFKVITSCATGFVGVFNAAVPLISNAADADAVQRVIIALGETDDYLATMAGRINRLANMANHGDSDSAQKATDLRDALADLKGVFVNLLNLILRNIANVNSRIYNINIENMARIKEWTKAVISLVEHVRLTDTMEYEGQTTFGAGGLKATLKHVLDNLNNDQFNSLCTNLNEGIQELIKEGYEFPSNFIAPGKMPLDEPEAD